MKICQVVHQQLQFLQESRIQSLDIFLIIPIDWLNILNFKPNGTSLKPNDLKKDTHQQQNEDLLAELTMWKEQLLLSEENRMDGNYFCLFVFF